jgi:hypothetical protein
MIPKRLCRDDGSGTHTELRPNHADTDFNMGYLLRIDEVIDRRVDEELVRAKTKFGRYNLDLIALETARADVGRNRRLLRDLCFLNLTGRRRIYVSGILR